MRLSRLHRLTEKKTTNQTKDFVTVKTKKKLKLDAHTQKKNKMQLKIFLSFPCLPCKFSRLCGTIG